MGGTIGGTGVLSIIRINDTFRLDKELGAGIRYRCHPLLKLAWRVYMSILMGGDMYGGDYAGETSAYLASRMEASFWFCLRHNPKFHDEHKFNM